LNTVFRLRSAAFAIQVDQQVVTIAIKGHQKCIIVVGEDDASKPTSFS
jgi:hypothetical protein